MAPVAPDAMTLVAEPEEALIVRVDSTKGQHYWFSDRRLLREDDKGIDELLRYDSVTKAHWMFSRLRKNPFTGSEWHLLNTAS